MSKRLAFLILHQGRPYLRYAVQAILPQVDKLMIFYSAKPSQGYQTDMECPDTREELREEAYAADQPRTDFPHISKIEWREGEWPNEVAHVNAVNAHTEGYDWLVRLDADEIYPPGMVDEMIRQAEAEDKRDAREYRIPFCHFWRSFSRVCRDGSHPIRLTRLKGGSGIKNLDRSHPGGVALEVKERPSYLCSQTQFVCPQPWEVLHFGYAQPTKYIEYKMAVSGHKSEWRKDWFAERWLVNAQRDVHPVMYPHHWHVEDYDKEKMPEIMRGHPYWDMEVIDEL